MVEVAERGRKIATGMCRYSAFLARVRVFCLLATFDPQCLDPGVVPVGPFDVAYGEVRRCPPMHGTRFPHRVARPRQQADGGPGVPQDLGMTAQGPQHAGAADQDPALGGATAIPQQRVQDGQAAPRLPGQDQGETEAREDIGLPIHVSGFAREPARVLELLDRLTDIAPVPEDHADGLVGDCGLRRRRVLGQHLTSGCKRFRWPRQRQGLQLVGIPGRLNAVWADRHPTNRIEYLSIPSMPSN